MGRRKVIEWLVDFLAEGKKIIIGKTEIEKNLFHRGRMLLLDCVVITNNQVKGEFTVTHEVCEGHEPISGFPVFRGVDIVEMGFQLLGVFLAKNPAITPLLRDKKIAAREIISVKFSGFIFPGDVVMLEMGVKDVYIEESRSFVLIGSGRIIAKVGGEKKSTISSLVLMAFNQDAVRNNNSSNAEAD